MIDDESESDPPATWQLQESHLIPIPRLDECDDASGFYTMGARVVAVFPGTTAFYAATVTIEPYEATDKDLELYLGLEYDEDTDDDSGNQILQQIPVRLTTMPTDNYLRFAEEKDGEENRGW